MSMGISRLNWMTNLKFCAGHFFHRIPYPEVSIGERKTFDIILLEDAAQLNEIVVIGYSVQEKGKITGAVNIVDGETDQQVTVAEYRPGVAGKSTRVVV
jgi:hypothetical protein